MKNDILAELLPNGLSVLVQPLVLKFTAEGTLGNESAASAIRDGIGRGIKRISGCADVKECSCAYCTWFKPKTPDGYCGSPPPAFVLETFGIRRVIRQDTIAHVNLVLLAEDALPWFMAALLHCGQVGIGEPRARFTVDPSGHPLHVRLDDLISAAAKINDINRCAISFRSPFVIEDSGKRLEELDFPRLIKAIIERLQPNVGYWSGAWMKNKERDEIVKRLEPDIDCIDSAFARGKRVVQVSRKYDGRESSLLGFTGDMLISGNLGPFMPLLIAGSLLHVGQHVSLDRGRYVIYSIRNGKAEMVRLFDLLNTIKCAKV